MNLRLIIVVRHAMFGNDAMEYICGLLNAAWAFFIIHCLALRCISALVEESNGNLQGIKAAE